MRPPPTAAPMQLATPRLIQRPNPCSLAASHTYAAAPRKTSPARARNSPVRCVPPPVRPARGSPSDELALLHTGLGTPPWASVIIGREPVRKAGDRLGVGTDQFHIRMFVPSVDGHEENPEAPQAEFAIR